MAKARLLQAVCAVALLAAAPAFAQQTTTQPATTGAGNSVNAPVMHDETMPRAAAPSSMAPAEQMDHMSGGMGSHSSHHAGMPGHSAMHARADNSRNATDQLNEQSFQAAQRGQSFSASDSGSSSTMYPPSSGSMNDTTGTSPAPDASGTGGGTGAK